MTESEPPRRSVLDRTLAAVSWTVSANGVAVVALGVRAIILARLLPVETFGVYALSRSIVAFADPLLSFGMGGALIHRGEASRDEGRAAAVHFTLSLVFAFVWALVMAGGALNFTTGDLQTALLVMVGTSAVGVLAVTPTTLLKRRVVHRRLAVLTVADAILPTFLAAALALRGETLWALLSVDLLSLVLALVVLYGWRPAWRPTLSWDTDRIRYFLRFGSQSLTGALLLRALDNVDDLWTGGVLGQEPLGFYSRAYRFARFPGRLLAWPITGVIVGTFAELIDNRERLSRAFYWTHAILIRTSFLFAGAFVLVAPELVRTLIGVRWMPMVPAFRVLVLYALLEPIKGTLSQLYTAMGRPDQIVRIRLVQLGILVAGILLLGPPFGITGVAAATAAMMTVGIGLLLFAARAFVDYSIRRLLGWPSVALVAGVAVARGLLEVEGVLGNDLRTGAVKLIGFAVVFAAVMFVTERKELRKMLAWYRSRPSST